MRIITKEEGKNAASEFLQSIKGEKSAYLYGSILSDYFKPDYSDINLLVIVKELPVKFITEIDALIQKYNREFRLSVLVLSESELIDFAKEYPIKFIDIQGNYQTITGTDLLKDIHVSWSDLKLHANHEILNFKMKLRKSLQYNHPGSAILKSHLNQFVPQIISLLKVMVIAPESENIPSDDEMLSILLDKKNKIDDLSFDDLIDLYDKMLMNCDNLHRELAKSNA